MTNSGGIFRIPPPAGWEEARTVAEALLGATSATDGYGTDHAAAVAGLSRLVGMELGLAEEELEALVLGALLHDLGKLGVPGAVLRKVAPLSRREWETLKRHPDVGARMVEPLWCLGEAAQATIRHHHERYDGRGYPDGLRGEDIPLAARVVAAADAYDVMVRGRPYQRERSPTEALKELLGAAGGQVDARVVAALARVAV